MRQLIYNAADRLLPRPPEKTYRLEMKRGGTGDALSSKWRSLMHTYRVYGAAAAFFTLDGVEARMIYGDARPGENIGFDTFFRVASVSKMVTAACVMKMREKGLLSIDDDIAPLLPGVPGRVTLRDLMTHTSPIRDGASYLARVGTGAAADELLRDPENLKAVKEKGRWDYSNFGAGLVGAVLEKLTGSSFECLMEEHLIKPLEMAASFYLCRLKGTAADAFSVLPFRKKMDAQARARSGGDWRMPDPYQHYTLAQGNCWMNLRDAALLGAALMRPVFLSQSTLDEMRRVYGSFGARDARLSQGIGTFVASAPDICPRVFYGHQGLAYGAVHGVFFDPEKEDGMVFLSSGASLRRRGVLADVNLGMMKLWQERKLWKE